MKNATLGFCKIWQILKRFAGTFRQAQTLKLERVEFFFQIYLKNQEMTLLNIRWSNCKITWNGT